MRVPTFLADVVDDLLNEHVPHGVLGSSRRHFFEQLRTAFLEPREVTLVLDDAVRAPIEFIAELRDIVDFAADRVLLTASDRGGRPAAIGAFLTEIESARVTCAPYSLLITAIVSPQSVGGRVRLSCSITLADSETPMATITELRPETDS